VSENPYKPPSAPLTQTEPPSSAKWFRWRYIPAAICFFYGGLGVLAVLLLLVVSVMLIARLGTSRIRFDAMVLSIMMSGIGFGMFLVAGRSWLRGKWVRALVLTVAALVLLSIWQWASGGQMREWVIPS
jgi:hypothetical protein